MSSPAALIIRLLIPFMLLELVGVAAEGRKQYPSFEGAIMLMAATLALVWNVIGGTIDVLVPGILSATTGSDSARSCCSRTSRACPAASGGGST